MLGKVKHFGFLDSRIFLFLTRRRCEGYYASLYCFECANDAKKNDPKIYFHMEPGENRPEVRKQWIYAMDLRNVFRFSLGSM